MLQNFFIRELQRMKIQPEDITFQHDGASSHFHRAVRDWLDEVFPHKWIGRRGPIEWTPRSPDLTPLDFYLWGFVKTNVYASKVHTLEDLETRIIDAVRSISQTTLQNTLDETVRRWMKCVEVNGGHIEHLKD